MYTFYLNWSCGKTPIKIKIWDTAGQERFGNLTKNYFQPLDGALIIFSFDNEKSFEQTSSWVSQIKESKEMPFILVGNKCDLPNKNVSLEDIQEKMKDLPYGFCESSAYTGQGVQNAMYSIIFECLKPVEEFVEKFKAEMKQQEESRRKS